jgi:hypothetical protein
MKAAVAVLALAGIAVAQPTPKPDHLAEAKKFAFGSGKVPQLPHNAKVGEGGSLPGDRFKVIKIVDEKTVVAEAAFVADPERGQIVRRAFVISGLDTSKWSDNEAVKIAPTVFGIGRTIKIGATTYKVLEPIEPPKGKN